jgi:pimeloyl-ACP methyl ester carboxylesterase
MSRRLAPLAVFWLATLVPPSLLAQVDGSARTAPELKELFRYEPTGLSLLQPYVRGKVPVVLVHGLWASPWLWHSMLEALEADPAIKAGFQFWTFGYSTGDPIPYTAHLLRKDLEEVRLRLDPGKADTAFDRFVLVGHSMGGLLCKMVAIEPGDRLWHVVSDRPFDELMGNKDDVTLLRNGLKFGTFNGVRRVIYIATPHQGSRIDQGSLQRVGTRLVRVLDPLRAANRRLVAANPPDFFREHFRKGMPSSIDELEWGSPILTGLSELAHPPGLKVHSIIAVRADAPPGHRSDRLVSYESAHIAGVASEKVVTAGHLCQDHREVIDEVRRILAEHAAAY